MDKKPEQRSMETDEAANRQDAPTDGPRLFQVDAAVAEVAKMVRACIQCGTCSGSCPNAFAMDVTPRRLWRMAALGLAKEMFESHTFQLCSSCYTCTLRCPRGLPLTDAMARLKQAAASRQRKEERRSTVFYKNLMESVRRHGRVREMEFMTLYFAEMKNPFLPLRFASLGMRLMARGKIQPQMPSRGEGKLDALFRKAAEMEKPPENGSGDRGGQGTWGAEDVPRQGGE